MFLVRTAEEREKLVKKKKRKAKRKATAEGLQDIEEVRATATCTCIYTVEPLNKGHFYKTFHATNLYSGNTFTSLFNGRNDLSQCVRYLEVPMYMHLILGSIYIPSHQ